MINEIVQYILTKGPGQKNSPVRNTVAQQEIATKNRSPLNQAANRPTTRAAPPDQMLSVAVMIAGNVMTASVT